MAEYKLPICWLGKSIAVFDEGIGKNILQVATEEMVNPKCHCHSEMAAFFCMEGHMLECHAGKTCEEAECSHYERNREAEEGSFYSYEDNNIPPMAETKGENDEENKS